MTVDVKILVDLIDKTGAGFRQLEANSRAAFSQLDQNAAKVQERVGRVKTAGGDLMTAGGAVALPIIGIGIAAAKEAIAVESSMADVNKVLGKTESQVAGVEQGIIALSTRSKDAIPLTVTGLAEIAAAGGTLGIPAKEILGFTEATAKMATAFDMTAEQAGRAIAKMRNVYSLDTSGGTAQITELGDTINQLSNNMAAKAPDIVEAMTRIGGVTRNFGLAKEDTAALTASIIALGNAPEIAATAINSILPALQGATGQSKKFQQGLQMTGISAGQMSAMVQKDGVGAINILLSSLSKLDPQSRTLSIQKMFGSGVDARVLATLSNDATQFSKALGLVGDKSAIAGSMQREFATRSATTANSMVILRNQLTAMSITIGKILLPMISQTIGMVSPVLAGITAFAQTHQGITRVAIAGLAVVAALGSILVVGGGILMFVGSVISSVAAIGGAIATVSAFISAAVAATGIFVSTLGVAVGAVGGLGVVLAAVSAIAFPIAAALALGATAYLVITNWSNVVAFFKSAGSAIQETMNTAWEFITAKSQQVGMMIISNWNYAVEAIKGGLAQIVTISQQVGATIIGGWNFTVSAIGSSLSRIGAFLQPIVSILVAPFRYAFGFVVGLFQGLGTVIIPPLLQAGRIVMVTIQSFVASITAPIVSLFNQINTVISNFATTVGSLIVQAMATISATVQRFAMGIITPIIAAISQIGTAINGWLNYASTVITQGLAIVTGFVSSMLVVIESSIALVVSSISAKIAQVILTISGWLAAVGSTFLAIASSIGSAISAVITKIQEIALALNNAQNAGQQFGFAIGQAIGQALALLSQMASSFFSAGANLIGQLVEGIKSQIGAFVGTIANAATQVRQYLPFSPAKVGALADLDQVSILGSVQKNVLMESPMLTTAVGATTEAAMNAITAAIASPIASNSNNIVPSPSFNPGVSSAATALTQGSATLPATQDSIASPTISPAATSQKDSIINLTYNPTINISGSTDNATTANTFRQELERHRDEIARIVASLDRDRRRLSYSGNPVG